MGQYFSIAELCASHTAKVRGVDNTPPPAAKAQLQDLINNLLDPVRRAWGKPIRVNSGYRSVELNRLVGGAANSQHTRGEAADLTTGSVADNKRLFELIRDKFNFDQLIDEKHYQWVHVSYRAGLNRNQVLSL